MIYIPNPLPRARLILAFSSSISLCLWVSSKNIPKDKKIAQEAINGLLRGELEKGRIQTREDVLNCLTEAGFEIARG